MRDDILAAARRQVLERGVPLDEPQVLAVLELPDERVDGDALALAHEVRMRWCGPAVEVEGIVSIKTGGCPEDCHFCSQSGRFETPVRAVRLDIPALVEAARETAATGATEFCCWSPRSAGPIGRLMEQVREAIAAINAEVEINIACSLGILTREQAGRARASSVCTATTTTSRPRGPTFPEVVHHPHLGRADGNARARARARHGGVLRRHHRDGGDGRPARRIRRAAGDDRARRGAAELPRPAPGTPFSELSVLDSQDALRTDRGIPPSPCRAPSFATPVAGS